MAFLKDYFHYFFKEYEFSFNYEIPKQQAKY